MTGWSFKKGGGPLRTTARFGHLAPSMNQNDFDLTEGQRVMKNNLAFEYEKL